MKNFKSIYLLALASCFALASFTFKSSKTLESIFSQEWVTRSYCDAKLELQTPRELAEKTTVIAEKNKKDVEKMSAYEYGEEDLMIMVSAVIYKRNTIANLKGAAAGALHEMQTRGGIEDFSYINKDTTISGLSSIVQRGTFRKGNDKINFQNLISAKENNLWQVMVAYRTNDTYGEKITSKVIKSVKINQ